MDFFISSEAKYKQKEREEGEICFEWNEVGNCSQRNGIAQLEWLHWRTGHVTHCSSTAIQNKIYNEFYLYMKKQYRKFKKNPDHQVIGETSEIYYILQVLNMVCFVVGDDLWGYFIVKIKLHFLSEEVVILFFQKKVLGSIFLQNSEIYYPDVKKSQWQSLKSPHSHPCLLFLLKLNACSTSISSQKWCRMRTVHRATIVMLKVFKSEKARVC